MLLSFQNVALDVCCNALLTGPSQHKENSDVSYAPGHRCPYVVQAYQNKHAKTDSIVLQAILICGGLCVCTHSEGPQSRPC